MRQKLKKILLVLKAENGLVYERLTIATGLGIESDLVEIHTPAVKYLINASLVAYLLS